jgi:hypothetical protein
MRNSVASPPAEEDGSALVVKIQEFFGLEKTPTGTAGRMPILIR